GTDRGPEPLSLAPRPLVHRRSRPTIAGLLVDDEPRPVRLGLLVDPAQGVHQRLADRPVALLAEEEMGAPVRRSADGDLGDRVHRSIAVPADAGTGPLHGGRHQPFLPIRRNPFSLRSPRAIWPCIRARP